MTGGLVSKGKRKAEPQDRSKWPAWPPGKFQFYEGCLDPTKSDGTIYRPWKLSENEAKTAKAEDRARKAEALWQRGQARAEERAVAAVIDEMVSTIAQYVNARQIDVKIWK